VLLVITALSGCGVFTTPGRPGPAPKTKTPAGKSVPTPRTASTTPVAASPAAASAATEPAPSAKTVVIDPAAPVAPGDYTTTITERRQALLDRGLIVPNADVGYYMDVQEARLRQLGGPTIRLTRAEQSVVLELPGPLNFEVGKAELSSGARTALAGVARVLVDYRSTIISVDGHTDDSGDAALNKALSERRAAAVAQQLITGGVEPERIVVVGYGPARPIADNNTEVGREANRRVVMRIEPLRREANRTGTGSRQREAPQR